MSSLKTVKPRHSGRAYWRSLDDLAQTPELQELQQREFPLSADEMLAPASRRGFLKLMGASMALAGFASCRWPSEEILPFTSRPEGFVPGVPMQFATSMDVYGSATGLLVTSYDGRPIKIEGNENHPSSLGASSAQMQASLLELYDPDRSRHPLQGGSVNTWEGVEAFVAKHFGALRSSGGAGLRFLSRATSSPSVADLRRRLSETYPQSRWYEYEAFSRDREREGLAMVFGAPRRAHLSLDRARCIVSLEDDFLQQHPTALRNARGYAEARDPANGHGVRLSVVESCFSVTGGVADRRVALRRSAIPAYASCVAARLLEKGLELRGAGSDLEVFRKHEMYDRAAEVADELLEHRGHAVLLAGPHQPAPVHALVALINDALGNVGNTIAYTADPEPDRPSHEEAIAALAAEIGSGQVQTLVVLDGNPVFDAPADLDFAGLMSRVPTTIHAGLFRDETAAVSTWHLPVAHYLETWTDGRAHDGTAGVGQPLIEPLLGGRGQLEILAMLAADPVGKSYDIVRRTFAGGGSVNEGDWKRALHDGIVPDTAWKSDSGRPTGGAWIREFADMADVPAGIELVFCDDASVGDGRYANNGWLQEMPDPLTKLTWDNAALLSPAMAESLGVTQDGLIRVASGGRSVVLPVNVMPGQAADTIGISAGYGRSSSGRVGDGVGVDVYPMRTTKTMAFTAVTVEPVAGEYTLASTQNHYLIDPRGMQERETRARALVREVDLAEYQADPEAAMHNGHEIAPSQLWRSFDYDGNRWGMAIDLNACIGCAACTVACQAENNIPVVGKDEVAYGRGMHWLRIDRYFVGDAESPDVVHQPVTCHHCENAPCEQVCPVAATVHDDEGLNVMVYNRCVGTRYCANNCPFKVRRFNYFNNHKNQPTLSTMVYNPEVTVRSRGVMEKCSFCVQRIKDVKIRARTENWDEIPDGAIRTACEQACPTRAISFGDLNDEKSRVRALQDSPRSYAMLDEVNIRPRTRYLARVRNRPDHGGAHGSGDGHGHSDGDGHGNGGAA